MKNRRKREDYDRKVIEKGLGLWEKEAAVCPDKDTSGARLSLNPSSVKFPRCVSKVTSPNLSASVSSSENQKWR